MARICCRLPEGVNSVCCFSTALQLARLVSIRVQHLTLCMQQSIIIWALRYAVRWSCTYRSFPNHAQCLAHRMPLSAGVPGGRTGAHAGAVRAGLLHNAQCLTACAPTARRCSWSRRGGTRRSCMCRASPQVCRSACSSRCCTRSQVSNYGYPAVPVADVLTADLSIWEAVLIAT